MFLFVLLNFRQPTGGKFWAVRKVVPLMNTSKSINKFSDSMLNKSFQNRSEWCPREFRTRSLKQVGSRNGNRETSDDFGYHMAPSWAPRGSPNQPFLDKSGAQEHSERDPGSRSVAGMAPESPRTYRFYLYLSHLDDLGCHVVPAGCLFGINLPTKTQSTTDVGDEPRKKKKNITRAPKRALSFYRALFIPATYSPYHSCC